MNIEMKKYRALIVEDSIDVRRALKAALELMISDFEVADVPSAEEGLLEFFRQPVDLLVTDFRLPGMTGFELLERMRVKNPNLKVILITGMPDPEYRTQALAGGANAFFYKPLDMLEFTAKVRELFDLAAPAPGQHPQAEAGPQTIGDWLADQRQQTDAQAVLLLKSDGRVKAQAGEYLAYDPEAAFVPELMSMAAASVRLARGLEQDQTHNLLEVRGSQIVWLVAPLDDGFILLYVLPAGPDSAAAQQAGRILPALPGLIDLLVRIEAARLKTAPLVDIPAGVLPPAQPEAAAPQISREPIEQDEDLAALVGEKDPGSYDQEDLQAFWEKAELADDQAPPAGNADVLSYEEARRLGLAPDPD